MNLYVRLLSTSFVLCALAQVGSAFSENVDERFYSSATELTPVSIWSENEVFVDPGTNDPERYGFGKAIDGNPETYACVLDSTRTGGRESTTPPFAAEPITAELVLDIGEERPCVGLRIATPINWRSLSPKNVSVYACDDPQGRIGLRVLAEGTELLPVNSGYSVCVLWERASTRYLLVRVNEGYQLRNRRQGVSEEVHFNTQLAELRVLTETPDDVAAKNPDGVAYPESRLRRDWLLQDAAKANLVPDECFTSSDDSAREVALLDVVLAELREEYESETEVFERSRDELVASNLPGSESRWRSLYYSACSRRRALRLSELREYCDQIFYVKHYVFGGTEGLTGIAHVSDAVYHDQTTERRGGSELCLLSVAEDGTVKNETLIEKSRGVIRDPNLSWDAEKLVFSMRDDFELDDYSLYEMTTSDRSVRRLTVPPVFGGRKYPCADYEPCYAPDGSILFASTRHTQINDCWPNDNTDIYSCDADGAHIRRLTYDELDVNFPQITADGRVVYTRWEYSDRNAYFLHPLFTMNPDGTAQTEYVGNNSNYPASYLQARAIPDSTKLIAIISGHHVPHKGKLALIDRSLGTQNGDCIEFVGGSSPDGTPGRVANPVKPGDYSEREIDMFGQTGPQYQYPYPLDEDRYLVAYCPEGWTTIDGPYTPPFGIYYMTAAGERELLAFDWSISCGQAIPFIAREAPRTKSSGIDPCANYGTYVVQDIYEGPVLKESSGEP